MIDMKTRIEDMKRQKRSQGNVEKDFFAYFPKVGKQQRKVVLKLNKTVTEGVQVGCIYMEPNKMIAVSGLYATRLLNDYPEYIEPVASTLMYDENTNTTNTYLVEKDSKHSRVTGKKIWYYKPVIKSGSPVYFDISKELGLLSQEEVRTQLEEAKVQKEVDKMKKEFNVKLKARKILEQETGAKLTDDEVKDFEIKSKATSKKKVKGKK